MSAERDVCPRIVMTTTGQPKAGKERTRAGLCRLLALALLVPSAHYLLLGALPVSLDDSGRSATTIGAVIGTYALAAGVSRLVFGGLVDIVRYRWSCLGFGAALLLAGLLYLSSTSLTVLYGARVLHGAGLGIFYSVTYGWLGATTPSDQRGRWFGIVGALAGAALVLMPLTGLAVYFRFGINTVYAFFTIMVALSLPLALSGRPVRTDRPSVIPAALLLTAGTTLLLTAACIGVLEAFIPLLAADMTKSLVTWLYVAFGVSLVAGRIAGGLAGDRMDHALLTTVSLLGVVGATAAVLISATSVILLGAAILTALGIGGATTNIFASVSTATGADRQARTLTLLSLIGDVGTGLGAAVAGAVSGGDRDTVLLFILAAAVAAAATSFSTRRGLRSSYGLEGVK